MWIANDQFVNLLYIKEAHLENPAVFIDIEVFRFMLD